MLVAQALIGHRDLGHSRHGANKVGRVWSFPKS